MEVLALERAMNLKARIEAMVAGLPADARVSLSVSWLRRVLEEEGEREGDPTRLLTLDDVAERVGRSVSTVRTWANTDQLPGAFKLQGRDWRVPESALARFIEDQASGNGEARRTPVEGDADLGAWRDHYRGPDSEGEAA